MTSESLISFAGLWLTVSLKGVLVYAIAWLLAVTVAKDRAAWRSFLWMAVLAGFPALTLLEWTGSTPDAAVYRALHALPAPLLSALVHSYLFISVVLAGLMVHSMVRLRLLRAYAAPLDATLYSAEDDEQPECLGTPFLLQSVEVLRSGQIDAPTSFGILKPVIVLPEPVAGTIYKHFVRAALIHELIKVLRFDALWTLLARAVQCMYFAHPLVWTAFRNYGLAREQVCDRWTVHTTDEVSEYELCLLAVTHTARSPAPLALDMPMNWTGPAGMRARIIDLQQDHRPESLQPWPTVAAAVVWMLVLAAMASWNIEATGSTGVFTIAAWPMLMGAAGALIAGAVLAFIQLTVRARRTRMSPPIDGMAARSRQTLVDCVHRLEKEWQQFQSTLGGTARRLEPVFLVLVVMIATMGLWLMASSTGGGSPFPAGVPEASLHEQRWP